MTAEKKKILRKQILKIRDEMPPAAREEKSRIIMETLFTTPFYQKADTILTYVNYKSEVNTTDLVNRVIADGKRLFAPKVSGETMAFYQLTGMNDLREGYKGIREPISGPVYGAQPDTGETLLLMPGAVFDENCHRIGYGKGFYDKYLKWISEKGITVQTLALCFECQVLSEIPSETHDIRPQMILTERKLRQMTKR